MVNVLLFVAEVCRRYFPASDIPQMISEFTPMINQDVCGSILSTLSHADSGLQNILTMIPVMLAFFPQTHTHLYLPLLFKLWEAFNSSVIDDRLIELCGELSEEHVAGKSGDAGEEGGAELKDVGIWTEAEWTVLVGKALGSMSTSDYDYPFDCCSYISDVPVGSVRVSHAEHYCVLVC